MRHSNPKDQIQSLSCSININDIFQSVKYSNILGFADNVKIFKTISNFNDPTKLQEDLNYFYAWCKTNELNLNI